MFKKIILVCTIISLLIIGCKVLPPTSGTGDTIKVITVEKITFEDVNDTIPFFITNKCGDYSCVQQLTLYSNSAYKPITTVTNIEWNTVNGKFSGKELDLNIISENDYNISCKVEYLVGKKSQPLSIDFCLKDKGCGNENPNEDSKEKEMSNQTNDGVLVSCNGSKKIKYSKCYDGGDILPLGIILILP